VAGQATSWYQAGRQWVNGIEADGVKIVVTARGDSLRADALNTGSGTANLRVEGPDATRQWRLESGVRTALDEQLPPGSYRFSAPPGVVLGSPRIGSPTTDPRLIVFILVDTLRADHLRPELTPGIQRAFRDGRNWRQATANCSWTLPSVASFFTSRPVLELSSPEGLLIGIPDGLTTWASALRRSGFIGGAVVANFTIHALNGFAGGFSTYEVPEGHGTEAHPDGRWVVDHATTWLEAHRGEDAFLYLHLMDPHEPYRSHADPGVKMPGLEPLAMRRRDATAEEADVLGSLYAEEVRHVDRVLTEFLDLLPVNAIVLLTSDHGEALGEHGAWGHGLNLYQEALHVPLLLRGPGVTGGEVTEPVQLLDLAPTLLELAGVQVPSKMAGSSLLRDAPSSPFVSTTFGGGPLRWAWRDGSRKVLVRMAAQAGFEGAARSRMREGRPLPAGAWQFDLESDPDERRPTRIAPELLSAVGEAFAATAGRLVPGLQLMGWGTTDQLEMSIQVPGRVDVVQVWSTARVDLEREGDELTVSCERADPVCGLAIQVEPTPAWIEVLDSSTPWVNLSGRVAMENLDPPEALETGAHLWRNPDRSLVVGGHDETLRRLRALGYIE
jgi:arylsulfatase A-like enzyme